MKSSPTWPDAARDRTRGALFSGSRLLGLGSAASTITTWLPRAAWDDAAAGRTLGRLAGGDLAIIAHYSHDGTIDPAFKYLATALRGYGYRTIVVSTSPTSLDDLAARCEPFADAVIVRGNVGFDFGSWLRGMQYAEWHGGGLTRRILLTNGSMFGPLYALDPILHRFADSPVWGMTESLDLRRHLQSWWLGFGPELSSSPRFRRYWCTIRPSVNKWETILAHELTWANRLAAPGTPAVQASVRDHGCRRNPLFFAWQQLIADCGVPFVKRSLFGPNYDRIDMSGWQEFLANRATASATQVVHASLESPGRSSGSTNTGADPMA